MRLPRLGASASIQFMRSSFNPPQSFYACTSHLALPVLEGQIYSREELRSLTQSSTRIANGKVAFRTL
jgi:hypothetical protein